MRDIRGGCKQLGRANSAWQILRVVIAIVVGAGGFAAPMAHAGPYDALYVFGDSLSDSGNVFGLVEAFVPGYGIPPAPYFDGRFSNGPNYADRLGTRLGLGAEPLLRGGTNYAVGGSTSRGAPLGLSLQRDLFLQLNGGVANPQALYVTWIGANDMQTVIDAAITDPSTISGAVGAIQQTIGDLRSTIVDLREAGARSFLVPNLPYLGLLPKYTAFNDPRLVEFGVLLTAGFNTLLTLMLDELEQEAGAPRIFRLDANALFLQALVSPGSLGFANVTDACLSGDFFAPGTACADPDSYLFWDMIHPSGRAHMLLGDAAFALVSPDLSERGSASRLDVAPVPLPGSAFLLGIGIAGLGCYTRCRKIRNA